MVELLHMLIFIFYFHLCACFLCENLKRELNYSGDDSPHKDSRFLNFYLDLHKHFFCNNFWWFFWFVLTFWSHFKASPKVLRSIVWGFDFTVSKLPSQCFFYLKVHSSPRDFYIHLSNWSNFSGNTLENELKMDNNS